MFSTIKELISKIRYIPSILARLNEIKETVDSIPKLIKPESGYVPIQDIDLISVKETYENILYKRAEAELFWYKNNLQEAVCLYDRLLYQSTNKILSGNYNTLAEIIAKLKVLRSFIFNILFEEPEVFSFYLYFIDTSLIHSVSKQIPFIDINKVFLVKYNGEESVSQIENVEKYVKIYMSGSKLAIISPTSSFEFNLKFRKTVLRVMYSLYSDKFYLYHLS